MDKSDSDISKIEIDSESDLPVNPQMFVDSQAEISGDNDSKIDLEDPIEEEED